MAEQFGVPQDVVEGKIRKGRFRVKANVKISKAKAFVNALEKSGALCSIVSEDGSVLYKTAHVAPKSASQDSSASSKSASSHAMEPVPLDQANQGFGALASVGESSLGSLGSNLDGGKGLVIKKSEVAMPQPSENIESGTSADSFELLTNPGMMLSGVDGSALEDELSEEEFGAALQSDDSFLPPEAKKKEVLELDRKGSGLLPVAPAPTPVEKTVPQETASLKPETRPEAVSENANRTRAEPSKDELPPVEEERKAKADGFFANRLKRRVFGTCFVLGLTFLPVYFWASQKDNRAYEKISAEVIEAQQNIVDERQWENLDSFRKEKTEELNFVRKNTAFTSVVLWSLLAGALGFVFLTRINWDNVFSKDN